MLTPASQSALVDRLDADLYRRNAYRITGLPVNATEREISRHLEKLKIAQRLGAALPDSRCMLPLRPPPDLDTFSEAGQRLRDPDSRLLDRFFWFWPGGQLNNQVLILLNDGRVADAAQAWRTSYATSRDAIAQHNLAVLLHATALDLEHDARLNPLSAEDETKRHQAWLESLRAWQTLFGLDHFWELWGQIGHADSQIASKTWHALNRSLPEALLVINARLVVASARAGRQASAEAHAALIQASRFEGVAMERALQAAAQPLLQSITGMLAQAASVTSVGAEHGFESATRIFADTTGTVRALSTLLSHDHPLLTAAGEEILARLREHVIAYTNATRNWGSAVPLIRQCFTLPVGAAARSRLEEDLAAVLLNLFGEQIEIAQNASNPTESLTALSNLAKLLDDVQRLGQLSATSGPELSDSLAQVAVAISYHEFGKGALYPALQKLEFAQRLARKPETRTLIQRGLETISERRRQSSNKAAAAWVVGGVILLMILSSQLCPSETGQASRSTRSYPTPRQSTSRSDLTALASEIELGRTAIARHEEALRQFDRSLQATKIEIDGYKAATDQIESEAKLGLDVDETRYDLLISGHNAAVERYNATLRRRQARYTVYETALRETNAKIDTYNRLVR